MYRFVFVALLFALALTKLILDFLNLRFARENLDSVPQEFQGNVKKSDMLRIQDYTSSKTKLGAIQFCLLISVLILFIVSGFLNVVASFAKNFTNFIIEGLSFFFLLGLIFWLLSLPFEIYETFRVEKIFGFNRQTFPSWLKDLFKSFLIGLIIGSLLLSIILVLVEKSGRYWWLYSWLLFFVFGILLSSLYPVLIAPLFNKFTPLDNEELLSKVKRIGERSGMKVKGILKMDAGKRSSHTNAYFTGLGRTKRIVLFDTLLERMDNNEIVSVVAHEAGHWKNKHLLKSLIVSGVYSLAWFMIAGLLINKGSFYQIFHVTERIPAAGLFLLVLIWEPVNFFLSPFLLAYSRKNERQADDAVKELTSESGPFKRALVKLTADNLANLNPHPAYVIFNYSHPPVIERVRRTS